MSFDTHDRETLVKSRKKWRRRLKHFLGQVNVAKKTIARRNRQIKAFPKDSQAKKAAQFFLDHAGWHEDAGRQNRAGWLDKWAVLIGQWMIGQPWCGLAVWMALRSVGIEVSKATVYTPSIRNMAQAHTGGFKAWHLPTTTPKVGWVAVYGTASSGPVHTGMYLGGDHMGEGNTSPGSGGSQSNGGGLYIRSLAQRRSWILGWAEPAFTK